MESREKNERNCKEESKKHVFRFRMTMRNFHIVMRNETERMLAAAY